LPQPLSPTRPKVSPAWTVILTPSTARSAPATRLGKPRMIGKCLVRFVTSSRVSMIFCSGKEMASYPLLWKHLDSCRAFLTAHGHGQSTPGVEAAALGWVDEVRHGTGNAANVAALSIRETVE